MRVDASGRYNHAAGVNDGVGIHLQVFAYELDVLTFNINIALEFFGSGDNAAVLNQY